jgi:hypothetical protein
LVIDMMLRWTGRTAVLAAVMLTTMFYASPCQSQSYAAATSQNSDKGLWVLNFCDLVEFQGGSLERSGSPRPTFGLISADSCSNFPDLTFDNAGNLWVLFGTGVGELTRNELKTSRRLFPIHVELSFVASGAADPFLFGSTMAFDPAGDLWVAGISPASSLIEFTPDQLATSGNPTPASIINFSGDSTVGPSRIQFDSAGDLWIVGETLLLNDSEAVIEYTPTQITELQMGESPTPALTVSAASPSPFNYVTAITFDKTGNLWMTITNQNGGANLQFGGSVEMFKIAGKTGTLSQPDVVITPAPISSTNQSLDRPSGLAFDSKQGLWVSSNISAGRYDTGFIVRYLPDQLTTSGSPVPPIVLTPNHKGSNLDYPSPVVIGPTVN